MVEGSNLVHYSRSNSVPNSPWHRGDVISNRCQGPASLIQARPTGTPPGTLGTFEVVVFEDKKLVHYTRDNTDDQPTWTKGAVISSQATGPGALIQNSVAGSGREGAWGNFEVVVLENEGLVHYYGEKSTADTRWVKGKIISPKATANGPGSIIQSSFGTPGNGNLEVVVLEGRDLVLYWADSSQPRHWSQRKVITSRATGPGSMIQSTNGITSGNPHGNFEVIVVEDYKSLTHYSRDNSLPERPWIKREKVSDSAIG